MKSKTKIKITVEKRQRTMIRLRSQNLMTAWCELCGAQTKMIAPAEAASTSGTTQLAIFRRVESGELHFIETNSGALLICSNSLENKNYKTKSA